MKILVLGGGPAGLYFSILMKKANATHDITVVERNPVGATFGFGVVFSERALDYLQASDAETYRRLSEQLVLWDAMELRVRGRTLRCGGIGFSAISRKELLRVLQERASETEVHVEFENDVRAASELRGYDLVVAADGVNSFARNTFAEAFSPSITVGPAHYIWFGATTLFEGLTFPFVEGPSGGWFCAHAYPYEEGTSTFIVETDDDSWRKAGFDRLSQNTMAPGESDLQSLELCERLFAQHLDGGRLLGNNSKWLRFNTIRNARWRRGNLVLLGDAAHTAHFSIGSGTRLAMEDAIALAGALVEEPSLDAALDAYERKRKPEVEQLQAAAAPSEEWWARAGRRLHLDPEQFAFNYFTRTRHFTYQGLIRRDRAFVRAVERVVLDAKQPVAAEWRLRDVVFPNRLAVGSNGRAEEVAGFALCGVGLVLVGGGGRSEDEWRQLVDAAHARGARIGARVHAPAEETVAAAAAAGVDVLEVEDGSALSTLRAAWPAGRPVFVRQTIAPDEAANTARRLQENGCDLVAVTGPEALVAADRVRIEEGLATSLPAESLDEANTLVLAGRADLVRVRPHVAKLSWERPD